MKTALITGVTGQDGSYLTEFLLSKGYKVYGFVRRTSEMKRARIDPLHSNPNFKLVYGDLCDSSSILNALRKAMPDEIYNLAAQSHVKISFEIPEYTADANGVGVVRMLEAIRRVEEETGKKIRFYQASTSELYGKAVEIPQKETTSFYPRSPYGIAKLYAFWITKNYRESYGMFACNGILFNHESPRRGENFVTRKITIEVAKIKEGISKCIYLGNLDAKRDWGHAKDYIEGMWLMLQKEKPDDYVLATGENHSVREFLEEAFRVAGIPIKSNGKKGIHEEYIRTDTGEAVVKIDPSYYRPAEVDVLLGDPSKAKKELGWKPKVMFRDLVKEMIDADMKLLQKELYGSKGRR
ncbi:GDP-mannose 4,6-dehydratase [Candidatus Woesearchaeota archaeon CG10_big_fil_rev_8_21_14_0_10_44_13]|nr:MAG: GDP-mannose 4,6-dehydratase [Candidatus Woesearchaeota archaeon CG10_big_fil_rev_8_21_14_0_10_44_13]